MSGFDKKEYKCPSGHTFFSIIKTKSEGQVSNICPQCSRDTWKQTTEALLEQERIDYLQQNHNRLIEWIEYSNALSHHIENLESQLKLMNPLSTDKTKLSHDEVIAICKELLIMEGANPENIEREYPIVVANKRYLADLVVLDDKDQVQIVVECGNLSDPLKIQLFSTLYPRFIWIPYTFVPNVALMNSYRKRLAEILTECKAASDMIKKAVGDTYLKEWTFEESRTSLAAILSDVIELEESLTSSRNTAEPNPAIAVPVPKESQKANL